MHQFNTKICPFFPMNLSNFVILSYIWQLLELFYLSPSNFINVMMNVKTVENGVHFYKLDKDEDN